MATYIGLIISAVYLFSMGGNNQQCVDLLFKYLKEEHMDKKKVDLDLDLDLELLLKYLKKEHMDKKKVDLDP